MDECESSVVVDFHSYQTHVGQLFLTREDEQAVLPSQTSVGIIQKQASNAISLLVHQR